MNYMPNTIALTGASGFLGQALTAYLRERGYTVLPVSHRLGKAIDANSLPEADAFVHCAWDLRPRSLEEAERINVQGSLALAKVVRTKGQHVIFISSLAAHPAARSVYGRTKRAVEQALEKEDCVIKPGTIIGNGGLFESMCALARKLPILPVFYACTALQTVYIDDLCAAIDSAITQRAQGTYAIAHGQATPVGEFYKKIAEHVGTSPLLMRMPGDMALFIVRCAEKLGVVLPISSDNLLGLKYSVYFETAESCQTLKVTPLSFGQSLSIMSR